MMKAVQSQHYTTTNNKHHKYFDKNNSMGYKLIHFLYVTLFTPVSTAFVVVVEFDQHTNF